jgi:hypothetical protein
MVFSNNLLLGAVSAAAGGYLIEQSLLFDGSSYLTRTPSVAGNRKTWTFSCWFKRDASTSAATQMLFAGGSVTGANDTNWVQVFINSDGTFGVGGGTTTWRVSSAKLADTSAWYHLTVNVDTTQATAADRIKMFLNGVQITSFGTNNAITLNADTGANSVAIHTIGRRDDASRYFSGLMALPILVDGAALDPTSFGELDDDGYWNPIEFTGADTVAYIPFGEGSIITDYSAETAKSFDGVFTSQAAGSGNVSRSNSGNLTCYMGKNFSASPRTVSGVICFGSNDQGFVNSGTGAANVTLSLYGKNGGAPSSATDGTLLGSSTFARTSNESAGRYFASSDAATEYDYIWIRTSHDGSADTCYMTEITFETSTGNGYGTNGGVYDFADSSWFGKNVSGADDQAALSAAAPSATAWLNITGAWTMGSGTASRTSTVNAIRSASVFTGDFSLALNMVSGATTARVGVYAANEDGTFVSSGADSAGLNSMTNSFYANFGAASFYRGASSTVGVSQTNGAITITRVSGVITINTAGGNHEFSATYTGPMRLALGGGGDTMSFTGIAYTADGQAGNSFFDTGFATTDQLADTPTDDAADGIGNFAIANILDAWSAITASNGNRSLALSAGAQAFHPARLTIQIPDSGKFYGGIVLDSIAYSTVSSSMIIGVSGDGVMDFTTTGAYPGQSADSWGLGNLDTGSGIVVFGTGGGALTNLTGNSSITDILHFAVDMDLGYLWFGREGTWGNLNGVGDPANGTNPDITGLSGSYDFALALYRKTDASSSLTLDVDGTFAPTGFKVLATQNLPAPTIADGSLYFETLLYTGNGSASKRTDIAFNTLSQPDFVWIKQRSSTQDHALHDSVRGVAEKLESNTTGAAVGGSGFGSDGFGPDGVGSELRIFTADAQYNASGTTYVAWGWKAGGAASSNTDGTITSSVSANTTSGFSIVTYTGTGAAATVGHGLGAAPKMIFAKERDGVNAWNVYHASIGATQRGYLNTTAAFDATAAPWNNTAPTTSVFTVGTADVTNRSAGSILAYCWSEVEGFSKFGSYTGNGSADGPFVYTGFRPAFVLIKRTDSTGDWNINDSARVGYNPVADTLNANETYAEGASDVMDILSNGFKIRFTGTNFNASGGTYIFAAFAEHPFQGDEGYTQARAR